MDWATFWATFSQTHPVTPVQDVNYYVNMKLHLGYASGGHRDPRSYARRSMIEERENFFQLIPTLF
jgi:hypothetical protein